MATATDERLDAMRRRIDRLEERAKTHMRRYVEDLKQEEKSATEAAHAHAGAVEEKVEQLGNDLDIAEHRLAAELAEDETHFTMSVEATLRGWDIYAERMQAKAAEQSGAARARVEHAISEIRRGRTAVGASLAGVGSATGEKWRETKTRVLAQLDELKRTSDASRKS